MSSNRNSSAGITKFLLDHFQANFIKAQSATDLIDLVEDLSSSRPVPSMAPLKTFLSHTVSTRTPKQKIDAKSVAFTCGSIRGGIYWAMMPMLAEGIHNQLRNTFHPESYFSNGLDLAASGMAASIIATTMSYPADLILKQMIIGVRKGQVDGMVSPFKSILEEGLIRGSQTYVDRHPVLNPWKKCLHENGLFGKRGLLGLMYRGASVATIRMGVGGAIWNVALKSAEEITGTVLQRADENVVSRRPKKG